MAGNLSCLMSCNAVSLFFLKARRESEGMFLIKSKGFPLIECRHRPSLVCLLIDQDTFGDCLCKHRDTDRDRGTLCEICGRGEEVVEGCYWWLGVCEREEGKVNE